MGEKWKDDQEFEPLTAIHLIKAAIVVLPMARGGRLIKRTEFTCNDLGLDTLVRQGAIKPVDKVRLGELKADEDATKAAKAQKDKAIAAIGKRKR